MPIPSSLYVLCENHDTIRSICEHNCMCSIYVYSCFDLQKIHTFCSATGSCSVLLASLPETHFTAEKEFRLRRKVKLELLPINLSFDFAEDIAETVKSTARELQRGSA